MEYKSIDVMVCEDLSKRMLEAKDSGNKSDFDKYKEELIAIVNSTNNKNSENYIKYKTLSETEI